MTNLHEQKVKVLYQTELKTTDLMNLRKLTIMNGYVTRRRN